MNEVVVFYFFYLPEVVDCLTCSKGLQVSPGDVAEMFIIVCHSVLLCNLHLPLELFSQEVILFDLDALFY